MVLHSLVAMLLAAGAAEFASAQAFYYSGPGFRMRMTPPVPYYWGPPPGDYSWSFGPNGAEFRASPALPPAKPLNQLSWSELRAELLARTNHLEDQLAGLTTGETWVTYLDLATIRRESSSGSNEPPDPAALKTMQDVLAKFEKTAANSEYRVIARRSGFAAVQDALAEFVKSPPKSAEELPPPSVLAPPTVQTPPGELAPPVAQ
jgi:hypothetical protein